MGKLICEACGGKLMGKPKGIFECQYCGTEYSAEWAKAKIQEIKGTVKIEGVVDVQGTVKIEGGANKESLLKRGYLALEDAEWDQAKHYFNQSLNFDARYAEAYIGMLCADYHLHSEYEIGQLGHVDYLQNGFYCKALRFASEELQTRLIQYEANNRSLILENENRRKTHNELLKEFREKIKPLRKKISIRKDVVFCANIAGNISCTLSGNHKLSTWKDIDSLITAGWNTVGICKDGRVISTDSFSLKNNYGVLPWDDIVEAGAFDYNDSFTIVGLKSNGCLCCWTDGKPNQGALWGKFKNIVSITEDGCIGLKQDGTVVLIHGYDKKVESWSDIVAVASGGTYYAGLTSDGRVLTTPRFTFNGRENFDTSRWENIVSISASPTHLIGLKLDGTVVMAGDESVIGCIGDNFIDLVAVFAGDGCSAGVKKDGTVVVAIDSSVPFIIMDDIEEIRTIVEKWKLFQGIETIALEDELVKLQHRRSMLSFFQGKEKRILDARIYDIQTIIKTRCNDVD